MGDREIHGRQSPKIANILATNPREAKTTREGLPRFRDRSIFLVRNTRGASDRMDGRKRRDILMDSGKIYREPIRGYEFRCATPRFNVIRRFLCKRVFRYSDRPTRLDANGGRTTVIPRDTRRSGTYPRDNVDFPATEHFIPHTCVGGKRRNVNPRIRTQTGALALNNGFCFARNAAGHEKKACSHRYIGNLRFSRATW